MNKYILLLLPFLLLGCADAMYNFKDDCRKMTNPPTDWNQQAECLNTLYPDLNSNQKAKVLMEQMDYEHFRYNVEERVYKVKLIYIYADEKVVWPREKKTKADYSLFKKLK